MTVSLRRKKKHWMIEWESKRQKKKSCWDNVYQKAFHDIKATIAKDVVPAYPDYYKEFEMYTYNSSKQRHGNYMREQALFFSRKLSET